MGCGLFNPPAGRPFEARNKPKGSAFTGDDKDFFRFKLGDSAVIPAFNEAVAGMKVGAAAPVQSASFLPQTYWQRQHQLHASLPLL